MKTAIYARISQDRNDDHQGVDRQLEDCRRRVEGQVEEFVDNGKSAWKKGTKRPEYDRLIEGIRAGTIDRVVCWHIDRLYRQMGELVVLCDLAEKGKVVIDSVMGGDFDLSTADGAMRAQQMVMYATYESRHKGERVRRKQEENRKQGLPSGGRRAFGWKDAMTPDPVEAALILEAVDDLFAGASLKDIAYRFNKQGVNRPQNTGSPWDANTVRLVVSNPRHAGLLAHDAVKGTHSYDRTIIGEAKWPAIIDRVRWEQLQAFLDSRGRSGRVPRRRSMLTGLLICGRCGTKMIRARNGATVMYRCPSRRPELLDACGSVSVDSKFLDPLLMDATFIRADSAQLANLLQEKKQEGEDPGVVVQKLAELDRRADAAGEMYGKGKLSARALEAASSTIEREREHLRSQLAVATTSSSVAPYAGRKGALEAAWPDLTVDQQRGIIEVVLGRVKIMPTTMRGRHRFDANRVVIA